VNPEVLQALTAAKGAPMPNEDGVTVDKLAELFRRERRLRQLVGRLQRSGEIGDEQIATMARYFGCAAAGKNTRSTRAPEWSHAECAQACQGLAEKYFHAMRYTYALDDSVFHPLSTWLWEWALWKREREPDWPKTVVNLDGQQVRYMRDLVDILMLELRVPSAFIRKREAQPDPRMQLMNVTDRVWSRRLSPVYEAIHAEYLVWLAIAHGHMKRRLAENDD